MTAIAEKLRYADWHYAEQDILALDEIGRRVATVGRAKGLITYSRLVEGLVFRLRTVNGGQPIAFGVPRLDRFPSSNPWELSGRAVPHDV